MDRRLPGARLTAQFAGSRLLRPRPCSSCARARNQASWLGYVAASTTRSSCPSPPCWRSRTARALMTPTARVESQQRIGTPRGAAAHRADRSKAMARGRRIHTRGPSLKDALAAGQCPPRAPRAVVCLWYHRQARPAARSGPRRFADFRSSRSASRPMRAGTEDRHSASHHRPWAMAWAHAGDARDLVAVTVAAAGRRTPLGSRPTETACSPASRRRCGQHREPARRRAARRRACRPSAVPEFRDSLAQTRQSVRQASSRSRAQDISAALSACPLRPIVVRSRLVNEWGH
jgi:hypothetical protein